MFLEKNRQRIEERFERLKKELPQIYGEVQEYLVILGDQTALAMKYLYAAMPCSDMGNYPFETFLDYAVHGVWLYNEFEEVKKLPEDIFLNYVLYHRVNEEEITPCRKFFYSKLKDRIQGLRGKEAALEVNYWCVEEATYQTTDDRTLSPMAVYSRGNGRCGEESVFSVSALRSVGIPARQVYAPRWSHCDDNHAWVEVWCDGTWYFTGACEPVPILNKGWFTNASSRAMMVHSHWFDFIPSCEEEAGKSGMVTMLNELPRYAATVKIQLQVTDQEDNPVQGAEVDLEVLNYAQFYPIARCVTDDTGSVSLTTGLGSLHIHVQKGELYAQCCLDTREKTHCSLVLKTQDEAALDSAGETWQAIDMAAPVDTPVNTNMPTREQKEVGDKRLALADRHRQRKTHEWVGLERQAFLAAGGPFSELRSKLLLALTKKDQTDMRRDVIEEHFQWSLPYRDKYSEEIFVNYVMNPRVDNEVLAPYREQLSGAFSEEEKESFCRQPKELWSWIEANIRSCPEKEKGSLITVPGACIKLKIASPLSKKILFVAAARTLGVAARQNPRDGSLEYWNKGQFEPVFPGAGKNCLLVLTGGDETKWTYFQNWSIARRVNGRYISLQLSDETWQEGEPQAETGSRKPQAGTGSLKPEPSLKLELEVGSYRILTANRLPNGNQFLNLYEFSLEENEGKQIELLLRPANLADMLENIHMPEFTLLREEGTPVKASALTDSSKTVLFWLEESKEPTEHILNELLERKEEFTKYADRLVFIVRSKEALDNPTLSKALTAFPRIQVYYDDFKENVNTLGRRMYVDHEKLPLIIVTQGSLNGIYAASGYNVGTGDMLLRLLKL